MDFAVRQMLLVIISGDLSPAVENPRRVPVSSADVRGIIDCDNGIAAPGGFDGGVNQELRMFLRIGNAFPLRENRRRIGIFGKKNQVDGGIALFQSLNGKVNRRIRLLCGAEWGITIDSETEEYTCVRIALPVRRSA